MTFFEFLETQDISGKKILEIYSKHNNWSLRPNVNWSFRTIIENHLKPKEYIGIDIDPGKYVDIIAPVGKLIELFNPEYFDIIIIAEVLHFIRDWKGAIENIKNILKKEGLIYVTTKNKIDFPKSIDFPSYSPYNYWKYDIDDIKNIFSDFETLLLREKPLNDDPGIIYLGKKPLDFEKRDIKGYALYSFILKRRTKIIPKKAREMGENSFLRHLKRLIRILNKLHEYLLGKI